VKADVLFINPVLEQVVGLTLCDEGQQNVASLGLCVLASSLGREGYKTEIIDLDAFGYSERDVLKYIDDKKPSIIGIHTTLLSLKNSYHLVKHLKEANRDNMYEILLGGPHITTVPETVKEMGLRYGMMGDSDESIVKFCKYIIDKEGNISDIPGLINTNNDTVKITPQIPLKNLDNLPTADYSLFLRKDKGWGTLWIDGVRGCTYNCSFCPTPLLRGRRVIYKSCPLVIEDMKEIVSKYSPKIVEFAAENLTHKRDWILQFCRMKKRENIKVKWGGFANINNLDKEMIKEMAESGCVTLFFGIESGNEKIREKIGKKIELTKCKEILSECRKSGIFTDCSFIIGLPVAEDVKFQIEEDIKFLKRTKPIYPSCNIYHIMGGTKFYLDLVKEGKIRGDIWRKFMHGGLLPVHIPDGYTLEDLIRLQVNFFRKHYLCLNLHKLRWVLMDSYFRKIQLTVLLESIRYEIIKPLIRIYQKFKKGKKCSNRFYLIMISIFFCFCL